MNLGAEVSWLAADDGSGLFFYAEALDSLYTTDNVYWLAFGLTGNLIFGSRFFVQWIASERAGRSIVPKLFWYLSILGSLILLTYAIHIRNPVFILGFLPNTFVYTRNLILIRMRA